MNVTAGTAGVYIAANSDAAIGTVISSDGNGLFGNVVLLGTGDFVQANMVSGFGGDGDRWAINSTGGSSPVITANVLTVTDGGENQAKSAWLDHVLPISNFSVSFVYQMNANGASSVGDGMAFVLQTAGTSALGSSGGGLGYVGVAPAVAYQINLYNGHTVGTNFVTTQTSGTYNSTGSVDLASGHAIQIQLTYDSIGQTVTETLTDTTTQLTYTHTYTGINLESLLGGTAYIGFTGGSGGATAIQTVDRFEYHYPPSQTMPNIVGSYISIVSSSGGVGTSTNPLVLQPHGSPSADGGTVAGLTNASAVQGIYLTQASGDLLIGQIESQFGDVSLSAPGGSILQGNSLSGSGMALADIRKIWDRLQLTNPLASRQSVTAFENQVDAAYQQYWQLLANGSVQNNTSTIQNPASQIWNTATGGTFTLSLDVLGQAEVWSNATGGTFSLTVITADTTLTTGPIVYNASANAIQSALQQAGLVARVSGSGSQADPWVITSPQIENVQGTFGNLTGGTGSLVYQPIWTTAPLAYNATASEVQAALNAIPGVTTRVFGLGTATSPWVVDITNLTNLAPNSAGLIGGNSSEATLPIGSQQYWIVATGGSYQLETVVDGAVHTLGQVSWNATAAEIQSQFASDFGNDFQVIGTGSPSNPFILMNADQSPIAINPSALTGVVQQVVIPVAAGAQRIWTNAQAGTFRIAVNHTGVIAVTSPLAYNASAADVESALNALAGVQAAVTGVGTATDPWIVSGLGIASIATTDDQLNGGNSYFQAVPPGSQQIYINGASGTFSLSLTVNGVTQSTGPITTLVSASDLQTALNQLPGVNVTVTGRGTGANPWLISNASLPSLSVNAGQLPGLTVQSAASGAVQLSNKANGGTFKITVDVAGQTYSTPSLDFRASATEIEFALNQISGVNVSVTGSGTVASAWIINGSGFTSLHTDDSGLAGGISSALTLPQSAQEVWSTATSGAFNLSLTINGEVSTTSLLPYNASAATVQAALNALPGVQVIVSGGGSQQQPWIIWGSVGPDLSTLVIDGSSLTGGFGGQNYTLDTSAISTYRQQAATALGIPDPTDLQVQTYANLLYQQAVAFFSVNLPQDWLQQANFTAYNPTYSYTATPDQVATLTAGATYTEGQLLSTIKLAALRALSGPAAPQVANLVGANITLSAAGSIGQIAVPTFIPLNGLIAGNLTPSQIALVAQLRNAGEARFVGVDGAGNTVNFSIGEEPAGVTLKGIEVSISRPVLVSMSNTDVTGLRATAAGNINLMQLSGDLPIDLVTSTNGEIQLTTTGDIRQRSVTGIGSTSAGWAINTSNTVATGIHGGVLTLTDGGNSQQTSAWITTPVSTSDFRASFVYLPTLIPPNSLGDGIAFVLQSEGPQALGGLGGALGYEGITSSVAFEINVWNGNTVGTRFVSDQSSELLGTTDPVNVASGNPIHVELVYDATAQTLTETLTDTVTLQTYNLIYYQANISAAVGQTGYVGFTGGSGGASALQTVTDFTFESTPLSPQNIVSKRITLLSTAGAIGTADRPLVMSPPDSSTGSVVRATAQSDVYLTESNGSLFIDQITSNTGDVVLSAPDGSVFSITISGFGTNGQGWTLNSNSGEATIVDDVLRLTDGQGNEARSVWFNTPVSTESFVATFVYTGTGGGDAGDGLTFTLQNDSRGPHALGGTGGELGYSGITPSVAFQFNLYNGHTQGTNFVSNGSTYVYNMTGDVDITSGHPIGVALSYDATTSTVTASLTDLVTLATNQTVYPNFNIASILGSSTAIPGFTAGDASAVSTQSISDFTFNSAAATDADISALTITLTAGNMLGNVNQPLQISQSGSASLLNATASNGVYISSLAGDLKVGNVSTTAGNIVLQANVPNLTQSIYLGANSQVSAAQGDVTFLEANGDITFALGSTVTAGTNIVLDPVSGSNFTLSGTLYAQQVQIIGGLGDDTARLDLAGLNANLSFNGRDGQDRLIVNGTDNATHYVVDGASILVNGLRTITTSDVQQVEVHGGAANDTFGIRATWAGVVTQLFGNNGGNTFLVGSSDPTVRGTLDNLQGTLAINGGGSSGGLMDEITIDDRAAIDTRGRTLNAGYVVTPTQVIHDSSPGQTLRPTFAGITYDGSTEHLNLLGSDGANTFLVKPSLTTRYVLNPHLDGQRSSKLDAIQVETTGTQGGKFNWSSSTGGSLTFTSGHRAIQFSGVKRANAQTLRAVTRHTVIKSSGASPLEFNVVYRGLTAADMNSVMGNNAAVRVDGPNGYSQLATYSGLVAVKLTGKLKVSYTISAPNGQWTPSANGKYKVQIVADQIVDSSGNSVPAGVIGQFRVKVKR